MKMVLIESNAFNSRQVEDCINYFKDNFGKTRLHHIRIFVDRLTVCSNDKNRLFKLLLEGFSRKVEDLYLLAPVVDGVVDVIEANKHKLLFIASGSEQDQLNRVFKKRGLDKYFKEILGGPVSKSENIKSILSRHRYSRAIMVGDAVADYHSSLENEIDFLFYSSLSNVKKEMFMLARKDGFDVIDNYTDLLS
jgi:phosphoglycolate phosphatase-like HAD superfamily hydrolase